MVLCLCIVLPLLSSCAAAVCSYDTAQQFLVAWHVQDVEALLPDLVFSHGFDPPTLFPGPACLQLLQPLLLPCHSPARGPLKQQQRSYQLA
jgi:hypothetical protein